MVCSAYCSVASSQPSSQCLYHPLTYPTMAEAVLVPVRGALDNCKSWLNRLCGDLEPWQIVVYTGGTTFIVLYVRDFLFQEDEKLLKRAKRTFFTWAKKIPMVRNKIEEEMGKARSSIEDSMNKHVNSLYVHKLPEKGLSEENLMKELEKYKQMSGDEWERGMVSGTVYNGDPGLTKLMAKTYSMFAWANPLHADVFPDVRKMEAEVVRMCCSMFNGDENTCGTVNSGGTESIMLACLAYRTLARERGIKIPDIVAPVTVHAAFDKAAHYFHMTITHVPVDEKTRMVDVNAMKRAIGKRTCMLVASAPHFPHGIIDPVQQVAALGKKHGIPVHVDCCLGGFLLPFMDKAGFPLPPFDFRCEGVTSISADTHKYGFAPKGSSVVLYKNKHIRNAQFFVQTDWTGGIYATPTIAGSRAGAIIAACWASMMHFGEDGYVESTKKIINTTRYIVDILKALHGIKVFGNPLVSVIGIGSDDFNVYRLFDGLVEKGWSLNSLQYPSSLHLCVTMLHTKPGVADEFIKDVKDCVTEIMKDPTAECAGDGAIYGMAQSIPDRSLVGEIAETFLAAYYTTKDPIAKDGGGDAKNGHVHNGNVSKS